MSKKILVITTDVYPFGHSELLYSENIEFIAKQFDFVEIFSLSNETNIQYKLPSNVSCHNLILLKNSNIFWNSLIFASKSFFSEFKFLVGNNNNLSFSKLKVYFNYILNAFGYLNQIEKRLSIYNRQENQFFSQSYWCNDVFISLLLMKNRSIIPLHFASTYMHGYDLVWERHDPKYLPLRWYIVKYSNILYFVSNYGKDYFCSKFDSIPIPTKVNYLGVSKLFESHLDSESKSSPCYRIVSCSRIIPLKRIHLIVESLAIIEDFSIDWIHFGDGELMDEISTLANNKLNSKYNISFQLMGNVKNEEIQKYYSLNQVDLFINVSEYEGIPISIMEAMAYGIPCLATNVGGVREIVNDDNGFLLNKDTNYNQIISSIEYYFKLAEDVRFTYQENAYNCWKENFNSKLNFQKYFDFYLAKAFL
jgi:colanic acid/amylovoran biosynthesis glycosyltransferase